MKKRGRKPRAHLPRMMAGTVRAMNAAIAAGTITPTDALWLGRAINKTGEADTALGRAVGELSGINRDPALDRLRASLALRRADVGSWLLAARAVLGRMPR